MGVTSFAYRLVLLLHILSAIIGFGGVLLNGVYASRAKKRPPAEGLAVMEVNTFVSVTAGHSAKPSTFGSLGGGIVVSAYVDWIESVLRAGGEE